MKEIVLDRLTISHFKGVENLEIMPMGQNLTIFGSNATGKTTIYDALTWLLFGKDSLGSNTFEIKPLADDGAVKDHNAVTTVEAQLSVKDDPHPAYTMNLRREFHEVWTTQRGKSNAVFSGHTTEFYMDGVPTQANTYKDAVSELVDEAVFKSLTSVTEFCRDKAWQKRRDTLYELANAPDDMLLMTSNPVFSPLAAMVGKSGVDGLKASLQAERGAIKKAQDSIPARIDELKKQIVELQAVDFDAIQMERDQRQKELDELKTELLGLQHNTALDAARNEARKFDLELQDLSGKNMAYRNSQDVPVEDNTPALRNVLELHTQAYKRASRQLDALKRTVAGYEDNIKNARAAWYAENGKTFNPGSCPTCGQPWPEAQKSRLESEWQTAHKAALDTLSQRGKAYTANLNDANTQIESVKNDMVSEEGEIAKAQEALDSYKPGVQPEIMDLPGYAETYQAGMNNLIAANDKVNELRRNSQNVIRACEESVRAKQDDLNRLSSSLAKREFLTSMNQSVKDREKEQAEKAARLDEIDDVLSLIEDFTRFKVGAIEESVNSLFSIVRWKLFKTQINGGIAECCDATVNGIPYNSLNNGARINAGIDVINALSTHYGVSVPLFIDNAESVVNIIPTIEQVVRLVVSEKDAALRIEQDAVKEAVAV
jgi:chromosome segregation ATPase